MKIDCHVCKVECVARPVEAGPNVIGQEARNPHLKYSWKEKATANVDHVPMVCPRCQKTRGHKPVNA